MTWTGHGHHIPGTPLIQNDPARPDVFHNCGGVDGCYFCSQEAEEYREEAKKKEAT